MRGVFLQPASEPGPNFAALGYFWPSELQAVLKGSNQQDFDVNALKRQINSVKKLRVNIAQRLPCIHTIGGNIQSGQFKLTMIMN